MFVVAVTVTVLLFLQPGVAVPVDVGYDAGATVEEWDITERVVANGAGAPTERYTSTPSSDDTTKNSQLYKFTVPHSAVEGLQRSDGTRVITETIDDAGNIYHFDAFITVEDIHPPPTCDIAAIRQLSENMTLLMTASLNEIGLVKTDLRQQTERVLNMEDMINRLEEENVRLKAQVEVHGDGLSTIRTDVLAAVTLITMMNDTVREASSALGRDIMNQLTLDSLDRQDDDIDMIRTQNRVIDEQTAQLNQSIADVIDRLNKIGSDVTSRMTEALASQLLSVRRQFNRLSNSTKVFITQTQEEESFYNDCSDMKMHEPQLESGVYTIRTRYSRQVFDVYCDMETAGGGWTVIQNRFDGQEDFARNWMQYKYGFGQLHAEFWLGNEKIYLLTNQDNYTMHIDITNFDNVHRYAVYDWAYIDGEDQQYRLHLGRYRGDAGDSLAYHDGKKFSTWDQDHDPASSVHSSKLYGGYGGWWQGYGDLADLNGVYRTDLDRDLIDGNIEWSGLGRFLVYYIKATTMKIKPRASVRSPVARERGGQ